VLQNVLAINRRFLGIAERVHLLRNGESFSFRTMSVFTIFGILQRPPEIDARNGIEGSPSMTTYTATTEGIRISVRPIYLDGQSDVLARKFVFAYFIRIENHSRERVQLLRRHWFITHSNGRREEVEGEGVVGKQPIIMPGHHHEYNSFCILETMEGSMEGTYLMQRPTGELFRVTIPRFILRAMSN
jgi:ApaG protein